jgi:L-alanine-DL-glutamate epimerase-like enolase superfamily enzyme
MKITSVDVIAVSVPMAHGYGEIAAVPAVVARFKTDDGLEGLGHAFSLTGRQVPSLVAATRELAETLVGADPRAREQLHRRLMPDGVGSGGVTNVAAAVLDVGIWDLVGKAAGLPLYQLLGGRSNRIAAYASLRLGRTLALDELPKVATSLVAQGFRAMKMNLGAESSVDAEVARVRAVREAIGPEIRLLADVNSRWTPAQAIRVGRRIDEYGLFWLEDPVPLHNLEGMAEVRRAIDTPISNGETLWNLPSFRSVFEARVVDVPMPDLARVGGITPFLKVAYLAEAFGLPLACHLQPEISAHIVAAVPNGAIVEYVSWAESLFTGCPTLEDGDLVLSDTPGHGLTLNEKFAEQHRIA